MECFEKHKPFLLNSFLFLISVASTYADYDHSGFTGLKQSLKGIRGIKMVRQIPSILNYILFKSSVVGLVKAVSSASISQKKEAKPFVEVE